MNDMRKNHDTIEKTKKMLVYRWIFIILISVGSFSSGFAAEKPHFIELKTQTGGMLLPKLQQLFANDAVIQAYGNQLIVVANEAVFQQIATVVKQLDKPLKKLLISVKQNFQENKQRLNVQANAHLQHDEINVAINHPDKLTDSTVNLSADVRKQNRNQNTTQHIQAVEGFPAQIQVGNLVPIKQRFTNHHGHSVETTELVSATQGFSVLANVIGDQVIVTITANNDRLSEKNTFDTKYAETVLRGNLNEWLSFGGIDSQESSNRTELLGISKKQQTQQAGFAIKVELAE